MTSGPVNFACLQLDKTPRLLLNPETHEQGECDYCGTPVLAPRAIAQFAGETAEICPRCIALRLDIALELLARFMYHP
jgi:hypothetical protein